MREMVLNHISLVAPNSYVATEWVVEMVKGMRTVYDGHLGETHLRHSKKFDDISCAEDSTLSQIAWEIWKTSPTRDDAVLLLKLSAKAPSWDKPHDDDAIADRKLRCEVTGLEDMDLDPEDGDPLLYCAITDSIAVGFPSKPAWKQDQIDVHFNELLPDGEEFAAVAATVDNLTRSEHADTIFERHQKHVRTNIRNFKDLWQHRSTAFPNLAFGPDVEHQLGKINRSDLSAIVKKLSILDQDTAKWRDMQTAMPQWSCGVRPESSSVQNNPTLIEARRFRSSNGNKEIFERHADFGRRGRIHLRFNAQTKEVEIGYIGEHLPLR